MPDARSISMNEFTLSQRLHRIECTQLHPWHFGKWTLEKTDQHRLQPAVNPDVLTQ